MKTLLKKHEQLGALYIHKGIVNGNDPNGLKANLQQNVDKSAASVADGTDSKKKAQARTQYKQKLEHQAKAAAAAQAEADLK